LLCQDLRVTEEAIVKSDIILRIGLGNVKWYKICVSTLQLRDESIALILLVDPGSDDQLAVGSHIALHAHVVEA
jgi:hypothetical protein